MTDLFTWADANREPTRHEQLLACFEKFDAENPMVYELFCRFTADLIARGRKRYSADAVLHRVRWHVNVDTQHDACEEADRFKINDHHSAFYARKWLEEHPEHDGFFRLRGQPSAERPGR